MLMLIRKLPRNRQLLQPIDFSFHFEESISLDEIIVELGVIFYDICLLDDNNQILMQSLNCGISLGSLYFEKSDDQIIFSNTDAI